MRNGPGDFLAHCVTHPLRCFPSATLTSRRFWVHNLRAADLKQIRALPATPMATAGIDRLKADKVWIRFCGEREHRPLSIFNILHRESKEDDHTYFLAWLLNPAESHGLNDFASRRFFTMVGRCICELPNAKICRQTQSIKKLAEVLIAGDFPLNIERISPQDWCDRGRMDLVLEAIIRGQPTRLVLENKICSTESNDQTCRYWDELVARQKTDGYQPLGVYLTPVSSVMLLDPALSRPECACPTFVHVNYQMLLDEVLVPCLPQARTDARVLIQQYVHTLNYSASRGIPVMAITQEERAELRRFWDDHQGIFQRVWESIATDAEMPAQDRATAMKYLQPRLPALLFIPKLEAKLGAAGLNENWRTFGQDRTRNMVFLPFSKILQPQYDGNGWPRQVLKFYVVPDKDINAATLQAHFDVIGNETPGVERGGLDRYAASLREFACQPEIKKDLPEGWLSSGTGRMLYRRKFNDSDGEVEECARAVRQIALVVEKWFDQLKLNGCGSAVL